MTACFEPSRRYPAGREGTNAGYRAHTRQGEEPCAACRAANAAYLASYGKTNADAIAAYNRTRRDARQSPPDHLKDVPCADCGRRFPSICMDFDHLADKSFTISRASSRSIGTVLAEIEKCEVVCANCHRIRTADRLVRKHPKGAVA